MPEVSFVPARLDLRIHQGDTPTIIIHFGMNLVGSIVRAQTRIAPESRDILFSFVVTMTDEAAGDLTIRPTKEGSARVPVQCYWDLEIEDSLGAVRTYLAGAYSAPRQVTRV